MISLPRNTVIAVGRHSLSSCTASVKSSNELQKEINFLERQVQVHCDNIKLLLYIVCLKSVVLSLSHHLTLLTSDVCTNKFPDT